MHTDLRPITALYPSLPTLVGAHCDGRHNSLDVAHLGILKHGQSQYLCIDLHQTHNTNAGILKDHQFNLCAPGEGMLVETDYVGLTPSKTTDKSGLLELFYGHLSAAPLIRRCLLNMECVCMSASRSGSTTSSSAN